MSDTVKNRVKKIIYSVNRMGIHNSMIDNFKSDFFIGEKNHYGKILKGGIKP
jgi:hypothetical protein